MRIEPLVPPEVDLRDATDRAIDRINERQAHQLDALRIAFLLSCEKIGDTPIERVFLIGLCSYWLTTYLHFPSVSGRAGGGDTLTVTPQKQIGPYRVDFLLESGECPGVNLVVECDGHDFHERTKEQAARDRSRDRDLQAKGYIILRFTGSEIYRDAWKCAEEVQQQIYSAHHNRSKGAA